MKHLLALFACSIQFALAFGQDTWHKTVVTPDWTISLPGEVSTRDVQHLFMIYTGSLDSNMYMAQYAEEVLDVNAGNLGSRYTAFLKGLAESQLKVFTYTVKDTSLGGTSGKFVRFTAPSPQYNFQRIYYYVTIANGHICSSVMYCKRAPTDQDLADQRIFYTSVLFKAGNIRENGFH